MMVLIVNRENRRAYEPDLREMFAQRRRLFVESLGWSLPLAGASDAFELDEYDHEDVIYLLAKDETHGGVRASARLLPTDRPHLLLDVFSHLCDGPVPRGARVWEITRFCPDPSLTSRSERLGLLWQIICASLETALLFDIEQLTFVANKAMRPLALGCGWDVAALGATRQDRHDEVTAAVVAVNRTGLRRIRKRFRIAGPVSRFSPATLPLVASVAA